MFLAVFLAISLPGGVILFKKKLDPAVPPMYLPEATRKSLPYMAPADAPDLKRYVPDELGGWVRGLAKEHGYESVLSREGMPVISQQRRWQVIGMKPTDQGTRVDLLLWDALPAEGELSVRGVQGKKSFSGQIDGRDRVSIPEAVRKELIYGGYPKPPKEVTWVSVLVEELKDPAAGTVLRMDGDSVTLFTN